MLLIDALTFTPDGKQIVAGLEDTSIVIWDVPPGGLNVRDRGSSDAVVSSEKTPDQNTLPTFPPVHISGACAKSRLSSTLRCTPISVYNQLFGPERAPIAPFRSA